jgi:hypothetical protein
MQNCTLTPSAKDKPLGVAFAGRESCDASTTLLFLSSGHNGHHYFHFIIFLSRQEAAVRGKKILQLPCITTCKCTTRYVQECLAMVFTRCLCCSALRGIALRRCFVKTLWCNRVGVRERWRGQRVEMIPCRPRRHLFVVGNAISDQLLVLVLVLYFTHATHLFRDDHS